MRKHLKALLCGIVTVLLALTMLFAACTQSESSSGSSSGSASTSESSGADSSSSGSSSGSSSSTESSSSGTSSSEDSSSSGTSSSEQSSSSGTSSSEDSSSSGTSSSEDSSSSGSSDEKVTVTNVTLSNSALNLNTGDSSTLTATVTTSNGSTYSGDVTWSTSAETVAEVTASGTSATVNALKAGTATITAEAGGVAATCTVTVADLTISGLTAAGAYSESIYATWTASNVSNTTAYYKLSSAQDTDNNWTEVDSNLIRMSDGDGRVDVVGLAAGNYDIKVVVNGVTATASNIAVSAYDRSGYAHFNTAGYDEGVGAYKDDGTLKDGALVIYLTDENKNDVTNYCYTYSASTGTYTHVDATTLITNYLTCNADTTYGSGHQAVGIGEILNNRRYSGNDRHNVGIAALCDAYGAVVIRVIGTVEADLSSDGLTATITGLTDYSATTNGGSVGDNGRMARMTNAHDLTIEGIGTDASIKGWGIHFIASDTLKNYQTIGSGAGKSFEVRNITFTEYPEDAIGMEGVQGDKTDSTGSVTSGASSASADILSPVEYCWIHNNSFLPGYCANPAESDKKEGDGSCDFKRGQYYTLSYNYFEYCHKTNLIGSSDTSLQYNISMHHNYWYNCGSRIPLARRANIHFYNNYVYGDTTDSNASLSYVSSVRANCYLYAENNYYEGCKSVIQQKDGVEKSYGNMYYQCFTDTLPTQVATRTTSVSNSCMFIKYSIDYSSFDTDSTLFYYNSTTQTSDCYLTDAATARKEAIIGAGVNNDDPDTDTALNNVTPSSAVSVGTDGLTVDLSKVSKGSTSVDGIEFTNITGVSSGTIKGKGQLVTFTLASEASVTINATGSSYYYYGELAGSDGTIYANKFTDLTIVLQAGTYIIASGSADKELTISSLSFADTTASSAARVEAATSAIQALSGYTATTVAADLTTFEGLVNTAQTAYSALTSNELAAFDSSLVTILDNAVSLLNNAKADVVEAYIAQIGTVTKDSYNVINTARTAYNALTNDQRALVENYSTLTAAETAYAAFAVTNVEDMINALTDVSDVSVSDRTALESAIEAYKAAKEAYNELDEDQQAEVSSECKSKLSGLADIEELYVVYDFVDLLATMDASNISLSDSANVTALTTYYNALTTDQLAVVTSDQLTKYNAIVAAYGELSSQAMVITFADSSADTYYSNYGNVAASASTASNKTAITYDGVTYSVGLKLNSSGYLTITTSTTMNITLYFSTDNSGNEIAIGNDIYTIGSDGTITATIAAGTYKIAKSSSESCLYVVVLTPAA